MISSDFSIADALTLGVAIVIAFMGLVAWFFAKFISDSRSDTIHEVKINTLEKKVAEIEIKMDKQYLELNSTITRNYNNLADTINRHQLDVTNSLGEIKVLIEKNKK